MAPARVLAVTAVFALLTASEAFALRIVNYNILNYPGQSASTRNPHFRTILAPLGAEVVVVQEMQSQVGVDGFVANVLNTLEPGQWVAAPFDDGNDTNNALFYKPNRVQLLGHWSWYPNPATNLRLVDCYRLKPVGYASEAAEFRVYSVHLKSSQGFETDRFNEAVGIRDSMNAMPPGTHAILMGDFNVYTGTEPAFIRFKENQADNDGRLYDPLNAPASTWNTSTLATIHTQSPCLASPCASGAATGGLDDRFDMFLPTFNLNNGSGLELVAGSYIPVGNDGLHYNLNITDAPTLPEGSGYATALKMAADHLPIRVDVQLPAILSATSKLDFGTLIAGGSTQLTIANPAVAPADGLTYMLSTSQEFLAPAGGEIPPGQDEVVTITTGPGALGPRAGILTITSDAADAPSYDVDLFATILDHSAASLDSVTVVVGDSLVFDGAGTYADQEVRVHNLGWTANQARLEIHSPSLTGSSRFTLLDAGTDLLAGVGRTYTVSFDRVGVVPDVVYTGELRIASADEPLPGAAAQPDLVIGLRGIVRGSTVSAPSAQLPSVTRLLAPAPNPVDGAASLRFDLAHGGRVRLDVLDLAGRRVATAVDRGFEPGRHVLPWRASRDDGGSLEPGVYFLRMSGDGGVRTVVRFAVVR
jgi:endonuclease/exonuclease/phosphatase family metal-dependent hydrolase